MKGYSNFCFSIPKEKKDAEPEAFLGEKVKNKK